MGSTVRVWRQSPKQDISLIPIYSSYSLTPTTKLKIDLLLRKKGRIEIGQIVSTLCYICIPKANAFSLGFKSYRMKALLSEWHKQRYRDKSL